MAIFLVQVGIVQLLMSLGADQDIKDHRGHSTRHRARRTNRISMMEVMSNPSAVSALDRHNLHSDNPPLHQATFHGSVDAVKLPLKQKDLDLETHDRNRDTPLHVTVRMQWLELVYLLLDHPRLHVNVQKQMGNTAFWKASSPLCDEITKRVLEHRDVDINFIGGCGKYEVCSSSLHHAIRRLDTEILQFLLTVPGIDVNILAAGQCPLSLAVQKEGIHAMRMLFNFGCIGINAREWGNPSLW
jgi:ankyrin repeat protein